MKKNYIKEKETLLEAVDILIEKRLKELKYNYCIEGRISKDNGDGKYEVKINDNKTIIKSMDNKIYKVGDIVKIIIFNNDFNDKQILCKR